MIFCHKVSYQLSQESQPIGDGRLKVKNMSKSTVGTIERPGKTYGQNQASTDRYFDRVGTSSGFSVSTKPSGMVRS